MDFRNRAVIVTGGAGALGTAVVGALVAASAACHVPHRGPAGALRGRDGVTPHPNVDLTDEAAVGRLFDAVPGLWASIHLAGGFAAAPIEATSRATLAGQIDLNLTTAFLCCRAAVRAMKAGGRIVNVAARPALEWRAGAGMTAYAASKAAVAAFTVALAEEVVGRGILVNAVAPSILDTPANRAAMPTADHTAWPTVDDVARTIIFLASPANTVTRGAVVPVYGRS